MKATIDTQPYVSLPTTDEFFLFPEDDLGTIPLDPTNQQHLRSMSPFILAMDAPSIGAYSERSQRPFRNTTNPSSPIGSRIDYQSRMLSPRISTYAQRPIQTGGVTSQEKRDQAGMVDRDQLISIASQHSKLKATPPIVFMINPQSMAFNFTNRQNYSDTSRYGFVFYRWGEELTTIEISCRIGSFIAGRSAGNQRPDRFDNFKVDGVTGLQFASRRDSAGWRQLMNILAVYRNSSTIADVLGRSRAYHAVGTQSIYYDGQRWVGRIKSMSFSVSEEQQNGGIDLTMSFEVFRHYEQNFQPQASPLMPMHEPQG